MSAPNVRLSDVCRIEKGGLNPQCRPDQTFAHYSIPAYDSGRAPSIEQGGSIKSQKTRISRGSVLISKLNPRIPRVWHVNDDHAYERICSTEFVSFQPNRDRLSCEYLVFALRHLLASGRITGSTTAATKSRERVRPTDVAELTIPLPPLPEQIHTVDILSRAEGIVRLTREAQERATEVGPALFTYMFGDTVTNPRAWSVVPLGEVAEVVSGITKGRKLNGRSVTPVPYLRVANVQAGYLNLSEMKEIEATDAEIADLRLRPGDVVLTEGGDFDKLGRGAQWHGEIDPCIHQNHVFRVRLRRDRAEPEYFDAYLQSQAALRYFLSVAKRTTNLASINMTQLRRLPVILPPIGHQKRFAAQMERVRATQALHTFAGKVAQMTFDALLARQFNGSLKAQQDQGRLANVSSAKSQPAATT